MRKLIAIGIIAGLFAPVGIGCSKETKKSTETKKEGGGAGGDTKDKKETKEKTTP